MSMEQRIAGPPGAPTRTRETAPAARHRGFERPWVTAVVCLVGVLLAGATARGQQCRTYCLPGEELGADGCCARRGLSSPAGAQGPSTPSQASQVVPADGVAAACRAGQQRIVGTSYCCWPGQVWAGNTCRGLPSGCPEGHHIDEAREDCALNQCLSGRERMLDGVHCCWPGQVWAGDACRGRPSRCPSHFDVVGESCSDSAFQRNESLRQAELERERERAQTELTRQAEEQRREEQRREEEAQEAQRQRDENYRFNGGVGYGVIGGFGVRDKRSTSSARAGGISQSMVIDMRFLVPLSWTSERRPGFGLEFGIGGAMHFSFSSAESVLNLLGTLDMGVRLGPVVASASAQIDNFDVAGGTTALQYGVGLGAGSLGRPNDLSWRIDVRWFPGAVGLSSDFNMVRNEFLLRASMGVGALSFGVFGRYFDQLGTLLDGFGGGLFLGVNFRS